MGAFPKFDPKKFFEETERTPAKVAKPAKITTEIPQKAKTLATLATPYPVSTKMDSGCRAVVRSPEIAICGQCAIVIQAD